MLKTFGRNEMGSGKVPVVFFPSRTDVHVVLARFPPVNGLRSCSFVLSHKLLFPCRSERERG